MSGSVVIIGAGLAGLQTAESLRAGGFSGSITLVGDEPTGPYHRPPLSKAWLAGEMDAGQLAMRGPDVLAKKQINLTTHTLVTAIARLAVKIAFDEFHKVVPNYTRVADQLPWMPSSTFRSPLVLELKRV